MADTAPAAARWTLADYLRWEAAQDTRNEFVDGRIVAMVGGTRNHNRIAMNVAGWLNEKLRGHRCSVYQGMTKVITPRGNVRYPDVVVDCGPKRGGDIAATGPTLVMEALSKSTRYVDQGAKLDDYQSIPTVEAIVYLRQDVARAELWTRDGQGRRRTLVDGLEADVPLPGLGLALPLAEAYRDVDFPDPGEPANDADAP